MDIERCCLTCSEYIEKRCKWLNNRPIEDYIANDFICDGYRTKRTGSFRRKLRREKENVKN